MTSHLPPSHIPSEERPRERLLALGVRKLRNEELLAIVIGSGTRNASSLELARQLLKKTAGPAGLDHVGLRTLFDTGGVGPAAAMRIVAGCELHRRAARQRTGRPAVRAPNANEAGAAVAGQDTIVSRQVPVVGGQETDASSSRSAAEPEDADAESSDDAGAAGSA